MMDEANREEKSQFISIVEDYRNEEGKDDDEKQGAVVKKRGGRKGSKVSSAQKN